jgi:biopolymer transport protein ExbD
MQLGSAASSPGSGENSVKSDINVTPLVDVCLVLLIIFMVVTPMLQQGIAVQLPETVKPEKMPEGARQVTIVVQDDGKIFVGQDWVPEAQLYTTLRDIYAAAPEKTLGIKGDRRLAYKEVRKIMRTANKAGFPGAGLITTHKNKPGGG